MLISRIFTSAILKYQNRFVLTKTRSFLSHPSVGLSSENGINQENKSLNALDSLSTQKPIDDNTNNEWLWAYLRDRQSFSDLTEAQRRCIIEIELQTLRESGDRVPEVVPCDRWTQLINTPVLEHRKSIYGYLFLRELYRKRRASIVAANNLRRAESAKRRQELIAEGKPPTNYPGYSSIFRHLGGKKPLTFGKAKRDNIRHQRFPIDRYVKFGGGSGKTLTIDQVYNILMTL
ncbi:unnamed protein product, partial [Rotaria magnacalcarata]